MITQHQIINQINSWKFANEYFKISKEDLSSVKCMLDFAVLGIRVKINLIKSDSM